MSRKATQVSPAVRAVRDVDASQHPCAPPAILSPTAVHAAQELEVVTVNIASKVSGTTAPPAVRVSHLFFIQYVECFLGLVPKPLVKKNNKKVGRGVLSTHIPTPTITVVHMMWEKLLLRAMTL